jgi:hypothetical protein
MYDGWEEAYSTISGKSAGISISAGITNSQVREKQQGLADREEFYYCRLPTFWVRMHSFN